MKCFVLAAVLLVEVARAGYTPGDNFDESDITVEHDMGDHSDGFGGGLGGGVHEGSDHVGNGYGGNGQNGGGHRGGGNGGGYGTNYGGGGPHGGGYGSGGGNGGGVQGGGFPNGNGMGVQGGNFGNGNGGGIQGGGFANGIGMVVQGGGFANGNGGNGHGNGFGNGNGGNVQGNGFGNNNVGGAQGVGFSGGHGGNFKEGTVLIVKGGGGASGHGAGGSFAVAGPTHVIKTVHRVRTIDLGGKILSKTGGSTSRSRGKAYVVQAVKKGTLHLVSQRQLPKQQTFGSKGNGGWAPAATPQQNINGGRGWEQPAPPPQRNLGGGSWQQGPTKGQQSGGQQTKIFVIEAVKQNTGQHAPQQSAGSFKSFHNGNSNGWAPAPQRTFGGGNQGWQQSPALMPQKGHGNGRGVQQTKVMQMVAGPGWPQAVQAPQRNHGGSLQQSKVYVVQDIKEATIHPAPANSFNGGNGAHRTAGGSWAPNGGGGGSSGGW
ncbi:glycine-rich cell wall structural protein 1.8-like [Varroa destructor]|uniref:Uncharacterized protein n=1 Tax=Varroa destructor TaxID=109461 RepID=A0A7M7JH67_VARDE|nr:glycine-rich cell wall structural protein 1.8-like [Varroa destructor]